MLRRLAVLGVLGFLLLIPTAHAADSAAPPVLPADAPGTDPAPAPGTAIVAPGDRSIMVYVPAGYFLMGMDIAEGKRFAAAMGYKDYHIIAAEEWAPQRRVFVGGYFIDQYDVTNELWDRYAKATGYKTKNPKAPAEAAGGKMGLYPAVSVTWAEAQQYANWAHKLLPTEAQWEKAARGTDGRWFPWGNELPTADRGVFTTPTAKPGQTVWVGPHNTGVTHYEMVGGKPAGASPYGCMDMAGNVYQWTSEFMEPYPNSPEADHLIPNMGHRFGVVRGGSFYHADFAYCSAKRMGFEPGETYYHVGFRCVWEPPAGYFKSAEFAKAKVEVAARREEMEKMRAEGLKLPPVWGG